MNFSIDKHTYVYMSRFFTREVYRKVSSRLINLSFQLSILVVINRMRLFMHLCTHLYSFKDVKYIYIKYPRLNVRNNI